MNGYTSRIVVTTISISLTTALMVAGTLLRSRLIVAWGVWTVAPAAVLVVDCILRRERLRVEQIIYLIDRRRDAEFPPPSDVKRIR